MNTKKYKDTTALTGEHFPPFSRHSTERLNHEFLSIMPPLKNLLFSEIARQTHDNWNETTNVTKTLPQIITIGYMKSKLKTKNITCIKICPTTGWQRDTRKKKKTPFKKSQILSNIISNNIYKNLTPFRQRHNCSSWQWKHQNKTDPTYAKRP